MDTRNILIYGGVFDLDSIEMLLYQAKKRMDLHGASLSVKKKLFNIIVECLDNIQKHTDELTNNNGFSGKGSVDHSFFSFDFNDQFYIIKTKNVVLTDSVVKLKSRIDKINGLNKDGLRKLYEQVIVEGSISHKGGAGLGLIDIALKSNNKIEYKFEEIDNKFSFFILEIKVNII